MPDDTCMTSPEHSSRARHSCYCNLPSTPIGHGDVIIMVSFLLLLSLLLLFCCFLLLLYCMLCTGCHTHITCCYALSYLPT